MWVIFDLFAESFNVYVNCSGITDVFVAPDPIQQLLSCKYLIRRGGKTVEQFQFFGWHLYVFSVAEDRVIGKVDHNAVILHTFGLFHGRFILFSGLISTEDSTHTGNHFFGVKRLHNIIISSELQTKYFVKYFAFG